MGDGIRECRYCRQAHGTLLLCGPARRVLDALYARGMEFDMPTLEFPEPLTGAAIAGDNHVLCSQLVAKAAIIPAAGVPFPALILTGRDAEGGILPSWVLPGAGPDLERFAQVVAEMTAMAIRRAREAAAS